MVTARDKLGCPISAADAQIAAICLSRRAAFATRNTRDFGGTVTQLLNLRPGTVPEQWSSHR